MILYITSPVTSCIYQVYSILVPRPSLFPHNTMQALEDRVITTPVVDKFDELLTSKQSPLCLFPTRKACHEFNSNMLSRLQAETQEIPCTDEVNETVGTFKWTKKAGGGGGGGNPAPLLSHLWLEVRISMLCLFGMGGGLHSHIIICMYFMHMVG